MERVRERDLARVCAAYAIFGGSVEEEGNTPAQLWATHLKRHTAECVSK